MGRQAWALLTVVALLAPGCAEEAKTCDIQLGTLFSFTGNLAGIGAELRAGANLARDEINAAGGVLGGQTLCFIDRDEGGTVASAESAANGFVTDGVPAVVGAFGSAFTLAATDILAPAGIVMMSPGSTSPTITDYADNGYLFRTVPSDALQGKLLAQKALEAGFATAAVTHVTGAYGEGLAQTFQTVFEAGGGTVQIVQEYVDGQPSYTDLLSTLLADSPDCVLMIVYPVEGAQMVRDINTNFAGADAFLYFTDPAANQEFIDGAGGQTAFSGAHLGTAPSSTGPNYEGFATRYSAANSGETPGIFQSNAYDAVYLLALAIEKAGAATGQGIRDALTDVSAGGTVFGPDEFAAARDAIAAGTDIDYQGASGEVDLDANGDTVAPYALWKVEGGAIEVTGTELPAD